MTTARGKGKKTLVGSATEPLNPVMVAPEFKTEHSCQSKPSGHRVLQVPPAGWQVRGPNGSLLLVGYCPFCGDPLVVVP